jgi:ubiquinone/menaquinone biosynthesis C-methylase UbiE
VTAPYDGAAERWARGATLVYAPIAREIVRRAPHPLTGRQVLDVGAGTGVGSAALLDAGARPVAVDLSADMLRWEGERRPPAVVARVEELPVATDAVDDVYAAFVLNHLTRPVEAMAEMARTVRPGGAVLAAVYANDFVSPVREQVDQVARDHGWEPPAWYVELKAEAAPLLGTAARMAAGAEAAGLEAIVTTEEPVDVGVTRAEDLVDYRFGQAHFAPWIRQLGPGRAGVARTAAIRAIDSVMVPYRPVVVFLSATVGS